MYELRMPDDVEPTTALDPSFFDGRLMIDILAWDWSLRIAINPAATGRKVQFQGLDYGRDFTIQGKIRAPRALRGRTIKVTLSPFGPRVRFGRGGLQHVGRVATLPPEAAAPPVPPHQGRDSYFRTQPPPAGL